MTTKYTFLPAGLLRMLTLLFSPCSRIDGVVVWRLKMPEKGRSPFLLSGPYFCCLLPLLLLLLLLQILNECVCVCIFYFDFFVVVVMVWQPISPCHASLWRHRPCWLLLCRIYAHFQSLCRRSCLSSELWVLSTVVKVMCRPQD